MGLFGNLFGASSRHGKSDANRKNACSVQSSSGKWRRLQNSFWLHGRCLPFQFQCGIVHGKTKIGNLIVGWNRGQSDHCCNSHCSRSVGLRRCYLYRRATFEGVSEQVPLDEFTILPLTGSYYIGIGVRRMAGGRNCMSMFPKTGVKAFTDFFLAVQKNLLKGAPVMPGDNLGRAGVLVIVFVAGNLVSFVEAILSQLKMVSNKSRQRGTPCRRNRTGEGIVDPDKIRKRAQAATEKRLSRFKSQ